MEQYADLVTRILIEGRTRDDRTGDGVKSVFGANMTFDLIDGFPLVTTKETPFSTILAELLWFVSGSTDIHKLSTITHGHPNHKTIWTANAGVKRDYTRFNGTNIGNMYGRYWRKMPVNTAQSELVLKQEHKPVTQVMPEIQHPIFEYTPLSQQEDRQTDESDVEYAYDILGVSTKNKYRYVIQFPETGYTAMIPIDVHEDQGLVVIDPLDPRNVKHLLHNISHREEDEIKPIENINLEDYPECTIGYIIGIEYYVIPVCEGETYRPDADDEYVITAVADDKKEYDLSNDAVLGMLIPVWVDMIEQVRKRDDVHLDYNWCSYGVFHREAFTMVGYERTLWDNNNVCVNRHYYDSNIYSAATCVFTPYEWNFPFNSSEVTTSNLLVIEKLYKTIYQAKDPSKSIDDYYIRPKLYVDQLQDVIDEIKSNPTSRRLVINAWNPNHQVESVLAACHSQFQFYVHDGRLSCQVTQRSADVFLGLPFNIASYALLTMMVAQVCQLGVDKLIFNIGDAHLYESHIEQARTLMVREPYTLPRVHINPHIKNIDDFTMGDFQLNNYRHHPKIPAKMLV